jgi:hypothetical protein
MSVCVCLCDVAFLSACSLPSERFETFLPSRRRNCFVILNKFIDGMPSRGAGSGMFHLETSQKRDPD